jgi:hypothetical protein
MLKRESLENLATWARKKDPDFDLYWFAVALNRADGFPDELQRWPVKMLTDLDPVDLKGDFRKLAGQLMEGIFR